jgi:hypothetical protein
MPVPVVSIATRVLQLAQQSAERINFVLVGELLPFGVFDQFQYFLHPLQRLFQRGDDLHHLVDGLVDGGSGRAGVNRGRIFLIGRHHFPARGGERRLRRSGRTGTARATSATAAPSPPPAAGRLPGWRRVICSGC